MEAVGNIYLCKLVLIQLGRDPTAFKVESQIIMIRNADVLGIRKDFFLLPQLRPVAELKLS